MTLQKYIFVYNDKQVNICGHCQLSCEEMSCKCKLIFRRNLFYIDKTIYVSFMGKAIINQCS